jgi:hypothetical protein
MNGISVTQETISPEMAAAYLAANTHNRPLVENRVNTFSDDIAEGNWVLNGESIKFSATDQLLDGQHRLAAIVKAGKPIDSIVIRGLDEVAQDTVDTGARRTLGNVLALKGESYVNTLAAAIRLSYYLTLYGEPKTSPTRYPSNSELLRYFAANADLRDAAPLASQAAHSALRIPSGIACTLYCHMTRIDAERAATFWDQLLLNDAPKNSAIWALRETLTRDLSRPHRMSTNHRAALIIKAWNSWLDGRKMDYIVWRATGAGAEDFPKLHAPIE